MRIGIGDSVRYRGNAPELAGMEGIVVDIAGGKAKISWGEHIRAIKEGRSRLPDSWHQPSELKPIRQFTKGFREGSLWRARMKMGGALPYASWPLPSVRSKKLEPNMDSNPTWSTAYKNQLPDSAFLYVDKRACEHTDREGRSHPLSCRHFPYRNHLGTVSLSHVRNAISRAPQSNLPSSVQREVQQKARRLLDREGRMAANRKGSSMSRSTNRREGSSRRRGINDTMRSVRRNPTVSTTQTGYGVLTGRKAHEGLVPYGPGKFDTTLDEAVYASINDIMDADVGNSSYDTWAAVAKNGREIADYIGANYERDIGNASLNFLRTKGAAGVIVFENSDGFVQVVYYDNAQELEKDWAETEEKLAVEDDSY